MHQYRAVAGQVSGVNFTGICMEIIYAEMHIYFGLVFRAHMTNVMQYRRQSAVWIAFSKLPVAPTLFLEPVGDVTHDHDAP